MSKIILTRHKHYADSIRQYKVFLDGERVGVIKNNEIKEFEVEAGLHQLKLKIDWASSPELQFNLKEGETLDFICGANTSPKHFFQGIWRTLIDRHNYIYLAKR